MLSKNVRRQHRRKPTWSPPKVGHKNGARGKPENLAISKSQGIGLRLIDDGKLGFGSTNQTDASSWEWLAESAVSSAQVTAADPFLELPKPARAESEEALELVDAGLSPDRYEAHAAFLSTVEAEVMRRDKRLIKVLRASYREGRHESAVVSSQGVSASSAGTSISFTLACVAVEGQETQVGYGFQAVRHHADLNTAWVIDKTVENTLALLVGKQVPSGRYDLVLDPFVAAEMLELLASALRGDQVLKGKSFLAAHIGKSIGSSSLTIVDDGRLKRGLGSSACDAEGLPTQTTVLVQNGVLNGFLYSSAAWPAKPKLCQSSMPGRSSYRGLPRPVTTIFLSRPGKHRRRKFFPGLVRVFSCTMSWGCIRSTPCPVTIRSALWAERISNEADARRARRDDRGKFNGLAQKCGSRRQRPDLFGFARIANVVDPRGVSVGGS